MEERPSRHGRCVRQNGKKPKKRARGTRRFTAIIAAVFAMCVSDSELVPIRKRGIWLNVRAGVRRGKSYREALFPRISVAAPGTAVFILI